MDKRINRLPAAPEIEESVLGALIIDSKAADLVLPILQTQAAFKDQRHQFIFLAIQELFNEAQAIDLLTISEKLKQLKRLDEAGGDSYLVTLTQRVHTSAHLEYHSRILMQYYFRRLIIQFNAQITGLAMDDSQDVFELLARWQKEFDKIGNLTTTGRATTTLQEALKELAKNVERLSDKREHEILIGKDTGFHQINKQTGGYKNQEIIVVAARPGMGKTSYVLKVARDNLRQGVPVGFISLEMSVDQLTARLVAIDTDFHLKQLLKTGFDKQKYFTSLGQHQARMEKYPLFMDDSGAGDISEVLLVAKAWKRLHGIELLIIDYLQLMGDRSVKGNRENEVANISRRLKLLAKELDIPILVLSQLSRAVETRGGDRRPRLSDLRDSGAIEQDADVVMFMFRPARYPDVYDLDEEEQNMGELNIEKHRNGRTGIVKFKYNESLTEFYDESLTKDEKFGVQATLLVN